MWMGPCRTQSFVNIFFHLAWCFQYSSMLLHVSALHSFSWMNHILLCGYPIFVYLFICWWTFECFHLLTIRNNTAMNIHVQKKHTTLTSTWSPKYCVVVHFKNYIKRLSYYMKSLVPTFSGNLMLLRGIVFRGGFGGGFFVCSFDTC